MITTSFDSTKTPLQDLLVRIHKGKLQLPDFQRSWVWDDERIRSLLASVSLSFPIGALMLLQTGSEHFRFKPRPLEGTSEELQHVEPETLILDGQQRLTALYQALMRDSAVETKDAKGKPIRRWYYIDMKKAVDNGYDRDEAVISVPEDRIVKAFGGEIALDLSTPEKEYAEFHFPVNRIFDDFEWRQAYEKYWNYAPDKIQLYHAFEREVIKRFEQYQLPVIELKKETPKEAICLIFERVNTGGVALNVFELLTASFAANDFQLRKDWEAREQHLKKKYPVLRNLQSDDFLQAITLLVTLSKRREAIKKGLPADTVPGIGCKRKDILKLTVEDWINWADRVVRGFEKAAHFLHGQKIFNAQDLPYRTQLVPLAAIFVELDKDADTESARKKIARWYWCGVMGELYGGTTETRFARDLPEVVAWVRGEGPEPLTVQESNFQASRLLTLRTRNSAAYKGIYALLMRNGCCDFLTGEPIEENTFFDERVDIHHIFPEKWCKNEDIPFSIYNSVINKTALAARTNRKIGGRSPSGYLPIIERASGITSARMDEILRTHCIDPASLRADDFWSFYKTRAEKLLELIEAATGKKVTRDLSLLQPSAIDEAYDERSKEWEVNDLLEEDIAL